MGKMSQVRSFDAIEQELVAYSDVPASHDELKAPGGGGESFVPKKQVVHSSAKNQAAFWEQLEREAAQSEQEIIAAYERKAALAAGAGALAAGDPEELGADARLDDAAAQEIPSDSGDEEAQPEELTLEERYARLMEVINKKPGHREILIRILRHCRQPREFSEVEAAVQGYPEFKLAGQTPYRLISFLIEGDGLEQLAIGFDGNEVTPEQTQGLTEDEIDDLIDCFHLRTTDVGRMVADEMEPRRRIGNIFALFSDRQAHYTEIMRFCSEPRKFSEIEALFKGRDLSAVRTLHPEAGMAIKPTVFIDNLEKAGAIVWKDGWVVTREGEAFLKTIGG